MDVQTEQPMIYRWLRYTLLFSIGGAALSLVALYGISFVGELALNGRVIDPQNSSNFMVILITTLVILGILLVVFGRRFLGGHSCLITIGWWIAFVFLAGVGNGLGGFSLLTYLGAWLVIGAIGGLAMSRTPSLAAVAGGAALAGAAGAAIYANRQVLRRSEFGRIPPDTVELLSRHTASANQAAAALPPNVPAEFRQAATGIVLDHLIRDWWENDNREGLTDTDIADLPEFVRLAWQYAHAMRSAPEALAVFRAVLKGLMGDWLANWNSDGHPGAPGWQYEAGR